MRTVQHVGLGVSIRRAAGGVGGRLPKRPRDAARARDRAPLGLETTVYTVNDEDRIAELGRLGVTGVFTDCPDRALAALGRRPAG